MSQASQLSLIPNAAGYLTVAASSAPTSDQLTITNTGFPITSTGTNALNVTYVGGAAAVEAGAIRVDVTPGTTAGGIWNSFRVVSTGAAPAGVTLNGIKFDNKSSGAGTSNAIFAGTGYDNIINYNGTPIISGGGGGFFAVVGTTNRITSAVVMNTSTNAQSFSATTIGPGGSLFVPVGSQYKVTIY